MQKIFKLFVISLVLFATLSGAKSAFAQTCSGSTNCCTQVPADCICTRGGTEIGTCTKDQAGSSCGTISNPGTCSCTLWCGGPLYAGTCAVGAGCTANCGAGGLVESTTCTGGGGSGPSGGCPAGQYKQTEIDCRNTTTMGGWGAYSNDTPCDNTAGVEKNCNSHYDIRGNLKICAHREICVCNSVAPFSPQLTDPVAGATPITTTVQLKWTTTNFGHACANAANMYKIYVDSYNPPTTLRATLADGTLMTNFTGVNGTKYYWYVKADNGENNTNSEIRSFTILDNTVSGTVYYSAGNTCSGTGWSAGGVSVSLDSGAGIAVSGTGTFSTTAPVGASHTLAVSMPAGFTCVTAVGCNTCSRSGVISPSTNNFFYLTDSRSSWWSIEGAGVYANGDIRSQVPAGKSLINAGSAGEVGAALHSSGSVDIGLGSLSSANYQANTKYRGKSMNYTYFASRMGLTSSSPTISNLSGKPTYDSAKDFYYNDTNGVVTAGSSGWNIASGEKYIIFVNGRLRVNTNVTVANGGFLMFVVKGDIIVDPSVTSLQGFYVADDNFVSEGVTTGNDVQLEVQGSVVGWGGISLGRSLGGGNSASPAEKFVYRPDLMSNMPAKMKSFAMEWQEVVPGTFGN